MRLDYSLLILERERNITPIESFIELDDTLLYWKARYYSDIPVDYEDDTLGFHNKMKSWEVWVKKEHVVSVGKAYIFTENLWQVYIDASGLAATMEIFFKRESEATAFAHQIILWMLSRTNTDV